MSDPAADPLGPRLDGWLEAHREELVTFRRHLHAHPELSFEEHRTTEFIEERLQVAQLDPGRLSSRTGLVCDLGTGGERRVALRADIDALAMDDEVETGYRSQ